MVSPVAARGNARAGGPPPLADVDVASFGEVAPKPRARTR
jgi:hypothetical protein